jgi:hypothetical protein
MVHLGWFLWIKTDINKFMTGKIARVNLIGVLKVYVVLLPRI